MNSKPQRLNFLRPVRRKKSCPESLREKCHRQKEVTLGSILIKYFHLFLESKEKKQGWLTVFYREKLIQEEAGGKSYFEKLRRGKQNSSEKTPDTDATTASQSQSLKGTSRTVRLKRAPPYMGELISAAILKKSVNHTILLWLNPLLGLKV